MTIKVWHSTCKHRDTEVIASGLAEKKPYSRPTCTGAIAVEAQCI